MDTETFQKCRLCGANGFHKTDVFEKWSSHESSNPNALSAKIFRCVGIRVERNDMLTTKICESCVHKIDDIVAFRTICAATDIQLRIELSNNDSSLYFDEEANAPIGNVMAEAVMAGKADKNPMHAVMTNQMVLEPNSSAEMQWDAVVINKTQISATTNGAHPVIESRQYQTASEATPTVYTPWSSDKSEKSGSDLEIDFNSHEEIATTKIPSLKNHRRSKIVKCQAPNLRCCKMVFESRDAMMYHATNYHVKGIKNTFECCFCRKSFPNRSSTQLHIDSVHSSLKRFKCPDRSCSQTFSLKSNLKAHFNSVHRGLKPFKCPNRSCSKSFTRKSSLKRHTDSVHAKFK